MNWLFFLILPHFISRYYLYKDIKKTLQKYPFSGTILDVGCGQKPYKHLFTNTTYTGIDFRSYSLNKSFEQKKPDIYFNSNYLKTLTLPFQNNSFDHIVSFQVLEHHPKPHILISEIVRIVKPRGYILITAPFIWGLHEEPYDYFRFTIYSLQTYFKEQNCKVITFKTQGSVFSILITILIDALIELMNRNKGFYICGVVLYPLLLLVSFLALGIDHFWKSDKIFLNYLILAKKNKFIPQNF